MINQLQQGINNEQPQKPRWKKFVLIIVGLIVISIIIIGSLPRFLNLFAKDIAPIDDSDLQLQKVSKISVPDKDNAYFDLIKLDNVIYEPKDKSQVILDMIAGKTWDEQVAEEIVSRNTQAFEYFTQAAHKPKYQNPESADPTNITPAMVLPSMGSWRQMARLSAVRVLYLAKQGKDKEALDEALNSVNIGQKIQESQGALIEYLVAIAIKSVGLETAQKIIPSSKLTNAELKQYAQGLNKFYKNENGLIMAFKGEYLFRSWTIDNLISGNKEFVGKNKSVEEIAKKAKNSYYFQPNKTKLLFAENTRENIKSVNQPCGGIKTTEIPKLTPTNLVKLYIEENAIGKILYDITATNWAGTITRKCQEDLLVATTQAMIAVKAFKNDTNNYPAALNELVPNYLSSTPQDPFDGKLLKYSAAKKILYSVGKDLQDSGGSIGDDWREMKDPTFMLNF